MVNYTTIRVKRQTRDLLTTLPFVKKQSFDEIINQLIESYQHGSQR